MSLCIGLGGLRQHACAALVADRVLGVCEQERITRVRGAGVNSSGLPDEALDEILMQVGRNRDDVSTVATAEECPVPRLGHATGVRLDHHLAHASAAFLASPFEAATILVCDDSAPGMTVWAGCGTTITKVDWDWEGPGLAELYSQCAGAFGFHGLGCEQHLEALARFDSTARDSRVSSLFRANDRRLEVADSWQNTLSGWLVGASQLQLSALAASIQGHLDDLLAVILDSVKRSSPHREHLCLGGSLFENSHFNSWIRMSGHFSQVFVPISPGNSGLAVGTALYASGPKRHTVTPFHGPSFNPEQVKATLDNCKLEYEWASETDSISLAIDALRRGELVAWVEGAMEWGPRALGARSILANPCAPYVLENLNRFLKRRAVWRGYALSVLESKVGDHFDGPAASPFMECDYVPRDPARLAQILPGPRSAVRVQTVGRQAPPRFRTLLERFGELTGVPMLVNTSFNGFREPIVASPRDAIRVFYGTGIDVLIVDRFLLRK